MIAARAPSAPYWPNWVHVSDPYDVHEVSERAPNTRFSRTLIPWGCPGGILGDLGEISPSQGSSLSLVTPQLMSMEYRQSEMPPKSRAPIGPSCIFAGDYILGEPASSQRPVAVVTPDRDECDTLESPSGEKMNPTRK